MTDGNLAAEKRDNRLVGLAVVLAAALLALLSARAYAGCWNDRSRLATVECLVDYHTLAIDRSQFTDDTLDKLWIGEHFYSDKSPVPALLMAGVYQAWQWTTGQTAQTEPAGFCFLMTLTFSGLAYVIAVWCIWQLGGVLRLTRSTRLLLALSFGLATLAPVYSRHVNNHILLLGVLAVLVLNLAMLSEEVMRSQVPWRRFVLVGLLAGLGYTIDLGLGPVLLVSVLGLVAWRCRRPGPVMVCFLSAVPWLVLHHAVNYAVGGTFKPANANPEYFLPGSPFNASNMTGTLNHTPTHFILYALGLLFGKQGFLGHDLPLFLAVPAGLWLLRRRFAQRPEVVFAMVCCAGTWLAYALTSTNYSGQCCSIRWFVPLLAPAYYVLAILLHHEPRYTLDLLVLSLWGCVLMAIAWTYGPWIEHMVPFLWPIQAAGLMSWGVCAWRRRQAGLVAPEQTRDRARAA